MQHRWTAPEIETLCSLAGDMPWPFVVMSYRTWSREHGYPERSPQSMQGLINRQGVPRTASGAWITCMGVTRVLGVTPAGLARWRASGLKAKQFGGRRGLWYFRRDWLRAFARQRPHLFAGFSEADLTQVLDCPVLAAKLAAQDRRRCGRPAPVICVETGRRFPSINAAARSAYVTGQRMREAILTGTRANGKHWRFA